MLSYHIPKKYLFIGALIFLFFTAGFLLGKISSKTSDGTGVMEVREKGYKFISPLLDYQSTQETNRGQILDLKDELEDYIDEQKNNSNILDVSVYLRELNNGPWLGINEKAAFSPASLLKVPILIAVLKRAENNPELLNQKIKNIPIEDGVIQEIVPSNPLKEGQEYTIWELMEHMILYSDNRAKNLLLTFFNDKDFERTYADLGIKTPDIDQPEDFMSVKDYASFFRILYNASYLNNDLSNKALELLSRVDYRSGIVSGVPGSIVVAHKFGEREVDDMKQLHDCGIVYYKDNPTLLCIMTRGYEWDKLKDTIKNIAQITHRTISRTSSK